MNDHRDDSTHNRWEMVNTERRRQPRAPMPIVEAILLACFVGVLTYMSVTGVGVCP